MALCRGVVPLSAGEVHHIEGVYSDGERDYLCSVLGHDKSKYRAVILRYDCKVNELPTFLPSLLQRRSTTPLFCKEGRYSDCFALPAVDHVSLIVLFA